MNKRYLPAALVAVSIIVFAAMIYQKYQSYRVVADSVEKSRALQKELSIAQEREDLGMQTEDLTDLPTEEVDRRDKPSGPAKSVHAPQKRAARAIRHAPTAVASESLEPAPRARERERDLPTLREAKETLEDLHSVQETLESIF